MKNNACKRILTNREAIKQLSGRSQPQWIESLSRIYLLDKKFLDESRICQEAIETNSQKLRWIEITITAVEKGRSRGSKDSLAVERYQEAVEIVQK